MEGSYLFDEDTYDTAGVDPVFPIFTVRDPTTGKELGRVARRMIGGKDPLLSPPP